VINWLSATYSVYSLLLEIGQGAERISDIVKSLKTYSYLDQAPVQAVDVHEGLDNTLVMLRSKLKEGITVRRDYATDLPKIQAYGSELNQVWTNIIDNAIDALDGEGEITLRTRRQNDDWIVVEILDNGPGIPAEIKSRIFDAFFTTKPVGKGTGLGLDISYKIVVDKHRGDIKVFSQPGKTSFQVYLPINFEKEGSSLPTVDSIQRMDDESIRRILERTKTIAVVGLSGQENSPAHSVPAYLQSQGYRIVPVNPNYETLLGEKSYPSLQDIPEPVDVVQIFRKSEYIPPIVDEAIKIGAHVVWMQEGIVNESAAQVAQEAGLEVVMDTCMRVMHKRLMS
jgi:predicted CoA-binding protein